MPFRPYLPDQDFLLPPSLREWLLEEHLAYFVSDVVDQLDLAAIYAKYGEEERGQPPYHPRMMTKLLVNAAINPTEISRRFSSSGNCVGGISTASFSTPGSSRLRFPAVWNRLALSV